MRHVYITTRRDDGDTRGVRGVVCDAESGRVLRRTEIIDPPHRDVAKARAWEMLREGPLEWHLIDEPVT